MLPKPVVSEPRPALWLQEIGVTAPSPAALSGHAEVAIIGGGFTGLWTAYELSRRGGAGRIVLLEADVCGAGASGRNGGFAMTWWSKFAALAHLAGPEQAVRWAQASADAVAQIGAFCAEAGIPDAFAPEGWMWAATNPAQLGAWSATNAAITAAGAAPLAELDRREAAALGGSEAHIGGVFDPSIAAVQPAAIARGLRTRLAGRIEIHERTAVRSIAAADPTVSSGAVHLRTDQGTLTADQVVLATNAWAARVPELGRGLVVVASDVVATEPTDAGPRGQVTVSDSRRLVNYYRRTPGGRLLFGRGGGTLAYGARVSRRFETPGHRQEGVLSQLRRIYPGHHDLAISHAWSGPVDYSVSGLPFFVRLSGLSSVIAALGFSGDGVGPTRLAGTIVADLLTGVDPELPAALSRVPRAPLPPEPVRYLGGRMVRAATARKEQAEDLSLTPSRATRTLAKLDPTGGGHAE